MTRSRRPTPAALALTLLTVAGGCPSAAESLATGLYRTDAGELYIVSRWDVGEQRQLTLFDRQSGDFRALFPGGAADPGQPLYTGPAFQISQPPQLEVWASPEGLRLRPAAAGADAGLAPTVPAPTVLAPAVPHTARDVSFEGAGVRLSGTLLAPAQGAWRGAVLMLHGSGPLGRHSFGPFPWLFVSRGVAVLLYDKRGTGTSDGDFRRVAFCDELAEDAFAGVSWLSRQRQLGSAPIGLFGISQGGMIAPLVAARSPRVGFVVNLSGNVSPVWRQELHDRRTTLRHRGFDSAAASAALALDRHALDFVRTGEGWEAYAALREKARDAAWLPLALGRLRRQAYPRWQRELNFEPESHWRNVRASVLALFGELDDLTPVADSVARHRAAAQAAGHRLEIRTFAHANHLLLGPTETGDLRELPRLESFALGAIEALEAWLEDVLGSATEEAAESATVNP